MFARIALIIALLFPVVALADPGSGSDVIPAAPGSAALHCNSGEALAFDGQAWHCQSPASAAQQVTVHAPDDLARDAYRAITNHDWFLLAGAVLSLLVLGARWLLVKKWPKFESELWGMALVAAMAGFGALGNAWLADERLASTTTLLGAVKVWAAAVFTYVTSKKLLASVAAPKA